MAERPWRLTLRRKLFYLRRSKRPEKIEKWLREFIEQGEFTEWFEEWKPELLPPWKTYKGKIWWKYKEKKRMRTTNIEVSFRWSKKKDWEEDLTELRDEILEEFMTKIAVDDYYYYVAWLGVEKPSIGVEKIEYTEEEYREVELEEIKRA